MPYLARRFRVITVEGRGNGRADRPVTAEAYSDREYVADAIAALDATGVDRAVVVGLSLGGRHALQLAAWYPERAAGVIAIGAALPWPLPPDFDEPKDGYDGWGKANRHYWLADYRGWVEFFMSQVFTEPHSIKQQEDGVGWGLETTAETLLLTAPAVAAPTAEDAEAICRQVRCPVLVVHGDQDGIVPYQTGVALARWTGGQLVTVHGGGHAPTLRDPVLANLLIRGFAQSLRPRTAGRRSWTRGRDRRKRVLYVSSPIGLGHVRRDLAIADELRARQPDLEIDWLTQHPVTQVLQERGERVHPASRWLASESAHIESEAGEHDLNVFQTARRMDEIMVANFMVFHDLVADEPYDLWIADEGWDVDHFLFDNPELKRTAYAWLTDFVGWLPMPEGGGRGCPHRGRERGAGRADAPLARHFEQQIHVAHRLAQYRAGRRLDYAALDPEYLAEAIVAEIDRPVDYRPVETNGAAPAAALLAELLSTGRASSSRPTSACCSWSRPSSRSAILRTHPVRSYARRGAG